METVLLNLSDAWETVRVFTAWQFVGAFLALGSAICFILAQFYDYGGPLTKKDVAIAFTMIALALIGGFYSLVGMFGPGDQTWTIRSTVIGLITAQFFIVREAFKTAK